MEYVKVRIAWLLIWVVAWPMRSLLAEAQSPGWTPVFDDSFQRAFPGKVWVNHITVEGVMSLVEDRLCFFRTVNFFCRQPLPRPDVRIEFDLLLPGGEILFFVRGGESLFSGGGADDSYVARLVAAKDTAISSAAEAQDTSGMDHYRLDENAFVTPPNAVKEPGFTVVVPRNQTMRVALQIRDGFGTVEINGVSLLRRAVRPPRSEFNRYLAIRCVGVPFAQYADSPVGKDGGAISHFRILKTSGGTRRVPLTLNTPAENRRATVEISGSLAAGESAAKVFQAAIDSLPASGRAMFSLLGAAICAACEAIRFKPGQETGSSPARRAGAIDSETP